MRQGSFRIFRLAGIDVFLHWSWFVVALIEINSRQRAYQSPVWNILEYLALFAIVTMHEFGHALACRQVGGTANRIVLWPLGGVAYVDPPPRPGAVLWSIVAGPLVNVALVPLLKGVGMASQSLGWYAGVPDLHYFLRSIAIINVSLLLFNMLPIYPLDGGKILWALLWFAVGRARSLLVAVILGFVGIAGFIGLALWEQSAWLGILAVFGLLNCWSGLQHARVLLRMSKLPRRPEFSCPTCKTSPPIGNYWVCSQCKNTFDTFQTNAACPHCGARFSSTRCLDCGRLNPIGAWASAVLAQPIG